MTAREWIKDHPWLCGFAVALAASILLDILLWVHLGNVRAVRDRQRDILSRMERAAEEFADLKARSAPETLYLRNPAAFGLSVVRDAARKKGIGGRVRDARREPATHDKGLLERVVSLRLLSVRREDLAGFLLAVESLDPAIRTKELRMSTTKEEPKLIDAKVTFSAYEAPATPEK